MAARQSLQAGATWRSSCRGATVNGRHQGAIECRQMTTRLSPTTLLGETRSSSGPRHSLGMPRSLTTSNDSTVPAILGTAEDAPRGRQQGHGDISRREQRFLLPAVLRLAQDRSRCAIALELVWRRLRRPSRSTTPASRSPERLPLERPLNWIGRMARSQSASAVVRHHARLVRSRNKTSRSAGTTRCQAMARLRLSMTGSVFGDQPARISLSMDFPVRPGRANSSLLIF